LLKEVWGITFDPGTNVIDVAVSRLRRRLIHQSRVRIDSVVGQGYALQVPPE
jgi:DNA-binding response OmpR family regulator